MYPIVCSTRWCNHLLMIESSYITAVQAIHVDYQNDAIVSYRVWRHTEWKWVINDSQHCCTVWWVDWKHIISRAFKQTLVWFISREQSVFTTRYQLAPSVCRCLFLAYNKTSLQANALVSIHWPLQCVKPHTYSHNGPAIRGIQTSKVIILRQVEMTSPDELTPVKDVWVDSAYHICRTQDAGC